MLWPDGPGHFRAGPGRASHAQLYSPRISDIDLRVHAIARWGRWPRRLVCWMAESARARARGLVVVVPRAEEPPALRHGRASLLGFAFQWGLSAASEIGAINFSG
jgi:hypothetical protein